MYPSHNWTGFIILLCHQRPTLTTSPIRSSHLGGPQGVISLRNDFYYINHFSLIIFYHSVWFGWALNYSGLSAGAHTLSTAHARAEDMTITNVIIKPQIGNNSGVWMTSCPEAMGWEFGDFEKEWFEIRLWAGPVQLGATGCTARLLGQIVQSA